MKVIMEDFYKKRPARIYRKISPTLREGRIGLLVLDIPKLINTQSKSMKNISGALRTRDRGYKELELRKDEIANALTSVQTDSVVVYTKTMEISPKSTQQSFPTLTSLSVDSLAKHSALLAKEGDLTTQEELYSLTLQGFSKSKDPNSSYWKTSKGCYLMTLDELLKSSSPRLLNWGMTSNGKCLTQRISESPRIGKECSLSDVLEDSVDEKYFLSEETTKKIFQRTKYERYTNPSLRLTGSPTLSELEA